MFEAGPERCRVSFLVPVIYRLGKTKRKKKNINDGDDAMCYAMLPCSHQ